MHRHEKNKENVQIHQEIIRDFKGFIKNVIWKSEEYENIMFRKVSLSLKGFRSHPEYFDIMVKDGKKYYIGDKKGFIPLMQ